LRDVARPGLNVLREPDRTRTETCDRSGEVWAVDVPSRRPAADANEFRDLGESRQPELHVATVNGKSEGGLIMT
jgi:hypothetical protein